MEKKVVAIYPEYSQINCEQKFVFLLQSNNIYINKLVAVFVICVLLVSNVVTYNPPAGFTVFKKLLLLYYYYNANNVVYVCRIRSGS